MPMLGQTIGEPASLGSRPAYDCDFMCHFHSVRLVVSYWNLFLNLHASIRHIVSWLTSHLDLFKRLFLVAKALSSSRSSTSAGNCHQKEAMFMRAAVIRGIGEKFEITDVSVAEPMGREVLV